MVEAGSLGAAARQLGCTQPAVSQHISRLERELDMPHFEQRAVLENALMLLALHDDPLAAQARVSLADLQLLRYISLPAFTLTATHIRHHAAQAGVTLHPTARVDDYDTAYVFVQLGLGHAIVPAMQGDHFQQEGGVRTMPIEGLPPLQVGWAARQFRLLSPAAHDFMAIFATLADQWRDRPGFTVL